MIPLAARQHGGAAGGGEPAGTGLPAAVAALVSGPGLADAAGWQPGVAGPSRAQCWRCVALKVTDVKRQDKSQGGVQARGWRGSGAGVRLVCPQQLHGAD